MQINMNSEVTKEDLTRRSMEQEPWMTFNFCKKRVRFGDCVGQGLIWVSVLLPGLKAFQGFSVSQYFTEHKSAGVGLPA
ncbi:unnamed protein product [Rangifer tarandus platyrhynchus]|uniref:Uncharacterized protein n=1 Tax=Rangifer tarandus platyrhynchus TaxID=3082113 RepID=A0AC59Z146_RANTA